MLGKEDINLANLLVFDQENAQILLKDYRMVLLSACAMGALRKELIETLGWEQARGVLKRFGYAAGLADGQALSERFPQATPTLHMDYGPLLHALEGMAKVVRIPGKSILNLNEGKFHVEACWENSFCAEQHLEIFGKSKEPVCWSLVGYATGHSTSAAGRKTLVVETECKAMGYDRCHFMADFEENFSVEYNLERRDYEALHLPKVLEDLRETIEEQQRSLQKQENRIIRLQSKLQQLQNFTHMLGSSESLSKAIEIAQRVSPVDSTVLILGESGTGKELMARGIHENSRRTDKLFIAVNCSALPETLQEAELFGYAKGAFTGATSTQAGLFESANGGTLFLDEIGDLTLSAQTKILRALEEGEIKRIGENKIRKVDVRIVAATNKDLQKMLQEQNFREDLYYRLNVVSLELPPLRKRDNDPLLLAEHFLKEFAQKFSKKIKRINTEAKHAIASYSWPGNIRELKNVIERAVILASGPTIGLDDLPATISAVKNNQRVAGGSQDFAKFQLRQELSNILDESERIAKALKLAQGNREEAAALLGISRTTLWRKMRELPDSM
jgi:DNA-binding NtrC family response regulator/predicted hydrocarbon binding protein